MYWFIWRHGPTGTAAVAHSAHNQLLHWLLTKEILALLHKQAELWPGTLFVIIYECKWTGSNFKWRAAKSPATGCQQCNDSSSTAFTAIIYNTILLTGQGTPSMGYRIDFVEIGKEWVMSSVDSNALFYSCNYCIYNLHTQAVFPSGFMLEFNVHDHKLFLHLNQQVLVG